MLSNIYTRQELQGLYRRRRMALVSQTVSNKIVDCEMEQGWSIKRTGRKTTQMTKPKSHDLLLEDRVWSLLYLMGFEYLSGEGGAFLAVNPDDPQGYKSQLDAVAIDAEAAIAIECKSAESKGRKTDFDKDIAKHCLIRERFINAVNKQHPQKIKRIAGLGMFTNNIDLSASEREKANQANVVLFNEQDLLYYESLAKHLGQAARYQFLSDVLSGRGIPGLEVTVPATKGRMGGFTYYSFSIAPEYLLKIAFVAHRARGQAPEDTYQRMVARSRLKEIRQYITDKGMFPTNIVVNFEKTNAKPIRFERTTQEGDQGNGVMGWLRLKPTYRSAWVIDGQHRLFAYSGHPMASKSLVSVLAFEGLPPMQQAKLFVDINAKQKSVKKSHLQELYGTLRWDAVDTSSRVDAILSRSIAALDTDADSPFFERIQRADDQKTFVRCLTVASLFDALRKPGLYVAKQKDDGSIIAWGPLWAGDNPELTVARTAKVVNAWFRLLTSKTADWWDIGAGMGGGLAMNDSVIAFINVLRSVLQYLDEKGIAGVKLDDNELIAAITPYAGILADFLGSFSEDQRLDWRNYRGVQGQTTRKHRCHEAILDRVSDFQPAGLQEFIDTNKAQTNPQAKEIIDRMELVLQSVILRMLRTKFGDMESGWWVKGIPVKIRTKATQRREEDDASRGGPERYIDLIDYRDIILNNWLTFQDVFGFGKQNVSKDKRTQWIVDLNERRKIVMHASSGQYVTLDQLTQLKEYDEWLSSQVESVLAD